MNHPDASMRGKDGIYQAKASGNMHNSFAIEGIISDKETFDNLEKKINSKKPLKIGESYTEKEEFARYTTNTDSHYILRI